MAKRGPRLPYTPQDEEKLMALKKGGKSFHEISKVLGREAPGLRSKWYALNHEAKKANRKKLPKIPKFEVPRQRPMIALVGNPSEVTATIRELFS